MFAAKYPALHMASLPGLCNHKPHFEHTDTKSANKVRAVTAETSGIQVFCTMSAEALGDSP